MKPIARSALIVLSAVGVACGPVEGEEGSSSPAETPAPTSAATDGPTAPGPTPTAAPTAPEGSPTARPATPTPAPPTPTLPVDGDGDGFPAAEDCDDGDPAISPGAVEACDGVDQDCDQVVDDVGAQLFYPDVDGDGWGEDAGATALEGCSREGYSLQGGDCDDGDPARNPGATERCDGVDENCDGRVDDRTSCFDDDGDGYCEQDCGDGSAPGDCDDRREWTYPGAVERPDLADNNCDGAPEEGRIFSLALLHVQLEGDQPEGRMGWSVAGGEDLDGDTSDEELPIQELVIGAPAWDPEALGRGAAWLLSGQPYGWPVGAPTRVDTLPWVRRLNASSPDAAGGGAGTSVALVGDMDGDGLGELAVGAPRLDIEVGATRLTRAGRVYLLGVRQLVGEGAVELDQALTTIDGTAAYVENGTSLAGGDINGDGAADLLMGAPHQSDGPAGAAGWVFVLPGRPGGGLPAQAGPADVFKFLGEPGNGLGTAVAWSGGHDGATGPGFVVGGLYDASDRGVAVRVPGGAYVRAGDASAAADVTTGWWEGSTSPEQIGYSVAGGGDFDGDGFDDLLIGRKLWVEQDYALAYGVRGGVELAPEDGEAELLADVHFLGQEGDGCPCRVASAGDLDGDGVGDVAISAAFASVEAQDGSGALLSEAGRVYVLYGRVGGWGAVVDLAADADLILVGEGARDRAGFYLAGAGDLNGDGYGELAVGAPFMEGAVGDEAGRVYLLFGAPR